MGKAQLSSESAKIDTELLLAFCLNKNTTFLLTWPEQTLTQAQQIQFESLLKLRHAGHPIAHLIGFKEFWGLNFKVTPDTLIPRPDTEILVETALEKTKNQQEGAMLDLGTGTGAIICALKSERPNAKAMATDFDQAALEVAQTNAKLLRLEIDFLQGSWFEPVLERKFNCIVSNPPYIEQNDQHLQQGDVRFDPITALTSGHDGLDDLTTIIAQAPSYLVPDGWLLVEHGYNQAEAVAELMKQAGLQSVELIYDYGNNPRVTCGQYNDHH